MPAETRSKRRQSNDGSSEKTTAKSSAKARRSNVNQQASNGARKEEPEDEKDGDAREDKRDADTKSTGSKGSLIAHLLSDDVFGTAYPPIDGGQGEKDLPQDQVIKPKPKEKAGQMQPDKEQVVDEKQRDRSTGKARGFTSPDLTPFEQLLCAFMLSKPLSHRLQLRTIATLFSPPYGQNTPSAIAKAGYEGRREAMYEARTQHKDKTADYLGGMVDGLYDLSGGQDKAKEEDVIALKAVRESAKDAKSVKDAADAITHILTSNLKGFGPGGAEIFLRRVQAYDGWQSVYPFMDDRSAESARQLGLLDGKGDALQAARQLADLVEQEGRSKQDYVRLIDVIVGLNLEKKIEHVSESRG